MVDQYYQMRLKLGEEYYGYHNVRQEDWPNSAYKKHNPWGNATFVKKGIQVCSYFEEYMLGYRNSADKDNLSKTLPVGAQSVTIIINGKLISVTNVHGYYAGVGVGKGDTPERLVQSAQLVKHLEKLDGQKILGGDFNLNPDTESIAILEASKMTNLISKFQVQSTRTTKYPEEKRKLNPFADYVFVDQSLSINSFSVDTTFEGSDHAPMYLSIDI
jgi:exonuclease III